MDLRLAAAALAAAVFTILSLTSPLGAAAQDPSSPPISRQAAIGIAEKDDKYLESLRDHPGLRPSATRNDDTGDWEVGFYSDDEELIRWSLAWVLDGQRGHDDQHLAQAAEPVPLDDHASEAGVDG